MPASEGLYSFTSFDGFIPVEADDIRSRLCQANRHTFAKIPAAAGNDCYFAIQLEFF
jgi:hypothetical protein